MKKLKRMLRDAYIFFTITMPKLVKLRNIAKTFNRKNGQTKIYKLMFNVIKRTNKKLNTPWYDIFSEHYLYKLSNSSNHSFIAYKHDISDLKNKIQYVKTMCAMLLGDNCRFDDIEKDLDKHANDNAISADIYKKINTRIIKRTTYYCNTYDTCAYIDNNSRIAINKEYADQLIAYIDSMYDILRQEIKELFMRMIYKIIAYNMISLFNVDEYGDEWFHDITCAPIYIVSNNGKTVDSIVDSIIQNSIFDIEFVKKNIISNVSSNLYFTTNAIKNIASNSVIKIIAVIADYRTSNMYKNPYDTIAYEISNCMIFIEWENKIITLPSNYIINYIFGHDTSKEYVHLTQNKNLVVTCSILPKEDPIKLFDLRYFGWNILSECIQNYKYQLMTDDSGSGYIHDNCYVSSILDFNQDPMNPISINQRMAQVEELYPKIDNDGNIVNIIAQLNYYYDMKLHITKIDSIDERIKHEKLLKRTS